MSTRKPEPCPGPDECGHTDSEHRAFDRGVKAGSLGATYEACPYKDPELVEAWKWGCDAGAWNYEPEKHT